MKLSDLRIMQMVKSKRTIRTFTKHLTFDIKTGCVLYNGTLNPQGYGVMSFGVLAHRFSYAMAHGQLPAKGQTVSHICHYRNCIAPAHLASETLKENIQRSHQAGRYVGLTRNELVKQGRVKAGKRDFQKTIPDSTIRAIKKALKKGRSNHSLAREYGISQTYVSEIRNGKRRTDVTI